MSTGQTILQEAKRTEAAFETRDFYLACFLRCAGYELIESAGRGAPQGIRVSGSPRPARTT